MPDSSTDLPLPIENDQAPVKPNDNTAASMIRQKLANLYGQEPTIKEEEREIQAIGADSKHQQYISKLMQSGQSFADIQTAWHNYYQTLPDNEKHEVWQEFYSNYARQSKYFANLQAKASTTNQQTGFIQPPNQPQQSIVGNFETTATNIANNSPTTASLKKQILNTVTSSGKLKAKHHILSLLFGLGIGCLVIFIFMFGFFNERFIAPFITPSRNITETSVIPEAVTGDSVGPAPEIIIPAINIEAPVVYNVTSIDNNAISNGLERGVVHYGASPYPGENGNIVIFGHSAENFFNHGHYKYVFSLLHDLKIGDTFMLNYYGQQYVYQVYRKTVVAPTDVSVLGPADKTATVTLITCDPPGVSVHRLIIVAEQITPAPVTNSAAPAINYTQQPTIIPSNSESLFQRLLGWL